MDGSAIGAGARPGKVARRIALLAPLLALSLLLVAPENGLPRPAIAAAAVAIVMAAWWMTEALPLAVTALLPLVLFPVLGVASLDVAARPYADSLIFLFLGGFLLARAMQRWQLNLRLARAILRFAGDSPAGIIAGIMAATAFLSMWVSNTATAMMMLPVGLSVLQSRQWQAGDTSREGSTALMLAIAYAATIGGMGTLIGTPPNALFAGFMRQTYGIEIGFAQWMMVGVPAVVILLAVAWLVLTRISFRVSTRPLPQALDEVRMGPMEPGARRTAAILVLAACGWVLRPVLETLVPGLGLSDAGIALSAAVALFLVPAGGTEKGPLLTWNDAREIRWDVLILFGGGLSLAEAISSTGLAAWIGGLATGLQALPFLLLWLLVGMVVVAVGELASNTAMASIFLPIAGATAASLGAAPMEMVLPVALAASLGFMLPVATPPNAIVYGSGAVHVSDMLRAGLLLNLAGLAVVTLAAMTIGRWVF